MVDDVPDHVAAELEPVLPLSEVEEGNWKLLVEAAPVGPDESPELSPADDAGDEAGPALVTELDPVAEPDGVPEVDEGLASPEVG